MITIDMHTVAINNIRDEEEFQRDLRYWQALTDNGKIDCDMPKPLPHIGGGVRPRYVGSVTTYSKPNQFDDDGYKPFIPESAPLINTHNRFDDDYDNGFKPSLPKPAPLIKIGNRFDDDDDGYNPY